MSRRMFTLDEANELIPRLAMELARIARAKQQADVAGKTLGEDLAVKVLQGETPPQPQMKTAELLLRASAELQAGIRRVNSLGCELKDVELGLVDFASEREGRVIHLCWQFGEGEVSHFHELDEGFTGRRPLLASATPMLRH